ncbi:MAG: DUF2189 domain-containing protein [Burkholderiaceae bacterium]|nr:DUF2189 domain-containing protein [Burkholderiaceae bacterium]MDZ4163401.1 DUF2189 domain-containing protein [Burkholderiales bacterium]
MNATPTPPPDAPVAVDPMAPFRWLKLGWMDFRDNPGPGLLHGLALAAFGWLLMAVAHNQFWLLAGAFSGFMLVAPILTTGLYEVSRRHAQGKKVGMADVFRLWATRDRRLVIFGLLLCLAGTGWVLTSASLITTLSVERIGGPADFLRYVVLAPNSFLFTLWLMVGGLMAAPVYASSVVAIPMLVDTHANVLRAVQTSWRVVAVNPIAMGLWAMIIMCLVGVGLLTALIGLVLVIPIVAHASWHAYQELTLPAGAES